MFEKYIKLRIKTKYGAAARSGGFTLVELLVVFFIMASILAVIIPDYLGYSSKTDFNNLSLDVALTIREAQGYGIGAKVDSTGGSFNTPYGVHFDLNRPSQFIFFEDTNKNNAYDEGGDQVISTYTMKSGYSITDLCTLLGSSTQRCKADGVSYVDVVYKRPNPDAAIQRNNIAIDDGMQDDAWIKLMSPDQATSSIHVTGAGGISAE
jgi:type II secretory pathway pseudopilin PulG